MSLDGTMTSPVMPPLYSFQFNSFIDLTAGQKFWVKVMTTEGYQYEVVVIVT
jgi:hypothetical protein